MIDMNYERNIALIAGYYAEEHQLIQTAEECAELAKAAIKRRNALEDIATPADRLQASRLALVEEIADVLVMIEQIIYLEGCEGDVRRVMGYLDQVYEDDIAALKFAIKAINDAGEMLRMSDALDKSLMDLLAEMRAECSECVAGE